MDDSSVKHFFFKFCSTFLKAFQTSLKLFWVFYLTSAAPLWFGKI